MAIEANTVQKWLGERIGVSIAAVAVIALGAAIMAIMPPRTRAEVYPGAQWDDVCHCRVTLREGFQWINAGTSPTEMRPVNIPIASPESTVRRAILGYFSEASPVGQSQPLGQITVRWTSNDSQATPQTRIYSGTQITNNVLPLPGNQQSFRQTIDITDFVNEMRGGNYVIVERPTAPWPFSFVYVVEQNDNESFQSEFPLTQISVNDFFYAAGTVPSDTTVVLNLEGIVPADHHYIDNGAQFNFFGGSWNNSSPPPGTNSDISRATYVMGNVAGVVPSQSSLGDPISNTNPQSVWPLNGWGRAVVNVLDPSATQLIVRIRNDSPPTSVGSPVGESGSMLIFQARLQRNDPPPPEEIPTDTCYGEDE
jgi:hypothetical protein